MPGRRVAVYGKGGIGKSTISANLSAALAQAGHTVLQVGCDPKHDSTRFLLQGRRIRTVLDYLRVTRPTDYRIEDVLADGYLGIGCVEAGGPKPGVGCAGRGIISTFELLDRFDLRSRYEMTIYDVLGDVVCGGFAVPIRQAYADTILVVTSGEFMALYAANNILRGIRNFDGDGARVAGLVFNRRNVEGEAERVARFASCVHLPVFADVPRSDAFTRAERQGMTAVEQGVDEDVCQVFRRMAANLCSPELPLHAARPLSDEELEGALADLVEGPASNQPVGAAEGGPRSVALSAQLGGASWEAGQGTAALATPAETASGKKPGPEAVEGLAAGGTPTCPPAARDDAAGTQASGSAVPDVAATSAGDVAPAATSAIAADDDPLYGLVSKSLLRGEPLHGCAFNGAVNAAAQLRDAIVVAHSPKSCAFIAWEGISSAGRRELFTRGTLSTIALTPDIMCTEMGDTQIVFGGMDELAAVVRQAVERRPGVVAVVSSCPAGIIGDDIAKVTALSTPDVPVVAIKADGNMSGDFMQGTLMAQDALARALVDTTRPKRPRTVDIVGEKSLVSNAQANYERVEGWLARMGVSVACRFIYDQSCENVADLATAELVLPAYTDYLANQTVTWIGRKYGLPAFDRGFPVGGGESAAWLTALGERFDASDEAAQLVAEGEAAYRSRCERLRPRMSGRRLMVLTYNNELDWVLQAAVDCGMEVVLVGIMDFYADMGFRTRLGQDFPVRLGYDPADRAEDIARCKPDVLLCNYAPSGDEGVPVVDMIPYCPDVGFGSGVALVERWAALLALDAPGDWREDARLLDEYYA